MRSRLARSRSAFTLIELMVVVLIIGMLIAILLPAVGQAVAYGRSIQCRSNLRNIGLGFANYQGLHDGLVIPSYNMVGAARGANNPLDGWPAILDRDRLLPASIQGVDTVFWCPDTRPGQGMSGTTMNPDGFQYWPVSSVDQTLQTGVTIPEQGFTKTIKCSYSTKTSGLNDVYFTGSVGYCAGGETIRQSHVSVYRRPWALIAVTDGVYAGQQSTVRIGENKRRISYRHPGQTTNALFADGHVAGIPSNQFPHARNSAIPLAQVREENMGKYTLYADPEAALAN
jgi:prepilin-type processing-associated H-X9-DG protein/prepilin-type N-terminal cleavage/methylation domain-containing protein